jgi:hypothetical protein
VEIWRPGGGEAGRINDNAASAWSPSCGRPIGDAIAPESTPRGGARRARCAEVNILSVTISPDPRWARTMGTGARWTVVAPRGVWPQRHTTPGSGHSGGGHLPEALPGPRGRDVRPVGLRPGGAAVVGGDAAPLTHRCVPAPPEASLTDAPPWHLDCWASWMSSWIRSTPMTHVAPCPSLAVLMTVDRVPHYHFLTRPQLLTRV